MIVSAVMAPRKKGEREKAKGKRGTKKIFSSPLTLDP
jgi:hypothetical protein